MIATIIISNDQKKIITQWAKKNGYTRKYAYETIFKTGISELITKKQPHDKDKTISECID